MSFIQGLFVVDSDFNNTFYWGTIEVFDLRYYKYYRFSILLDNLLEVKWINTGNGRGTILYFGKVQILSK